MIFVQPENSFPIKSPKMLAVYQEIADYAFHDRSCIFLGPTGAGKDFAARYYHQIWTKSGNGSGEFFAINCSVLTDTIAHSELFGHVQGAFTGAHRAKKGMFQVADKGVLFMDEIGDLPPAVQPMLLRALEPETGKAAPLGGITTFRTDTVRVLCATERPVRDLRPALVNRLGKHVTIPSLDERPEDRDASIEYFVLNALIKRRDIADLANKYRDIESPPKDWKASRVKELAGDLAQVLLPLVAVRKWPGNFRALRIALDTAIVRAHITENWQGFCRQAVNFFNQHAGIYSEQGTSEPVPVTSELLPEQEWSGHPLYTRVDQALSTASDKEKQQWTLWLEKTRDRSFHISDLLGSISSIKKRTCQKRLGELIRAGLVTAENRSKGFYRSIEISSMAAVSSPKRFPDLFPLPACSSHKNEAGEPEHLMDTLSHARHLFLAGVNPENGSAQAIALGRALSSRRTVYYFDLCDGGMEAWIRFWIEWLLHEEILETNLHDEFRAHGPAFVVLLLAGYLSIHLAQEPEPLLILDHLHVLNREDERQALLHMLRFWRPAQFLLVGGKLHFSDEMIQKTGIVELSVDRKE